MPETQGTLATPEELTAWWVGHFKTGPLAREEVTVAEAMDALQKHWAIRWKEGQRWTTMPVSRDVLYQVLDVEGTGQTGPDHEQLTHRLCEHMAFLNYRQAGPERQEDAHIWHNDDGSVLRITSHTSVDTTRGSALLRLVDHEGKSSRPTIVGPTGAAFIASHMLLATHGPDMVDPASIPALHLTHDQVRQAARQAADQAQDGDEATELVADAVWELVAPHLAAAGLSEIVDTAKALRDLDQSRRDLDRARIELSVAQYQYEQLRADIDPDHVGPY